MNQHTEFYEFMKLTKFRKNQQFNSKPQNLISVIAYIQNYLNLNNDVFLIIEELIKQYGISILLCFQNFYSKVRQSQAQQANQYTQKFQRIASLVKHTVKPNKFQQLKFFQIFGLSTKGFKVKQKTEQQMFFLSKLQQIRNLLQKFKFKVQYSTEYPQMKLNEKIQQQLISVKQTTFQNIFSQYYFDKMFNRTVTKYKECYNKEIPLKKQKQYFLDEAVSSVDKTMSKTQSTTCSINQGLSFSSNSITSFQQSNSNSSFQNLILTQTILQSDYDCKKKDQIKYINFSKVDLCCRTFFFEDEQILQPQSEKIQFKCYRYPYNFQKVSIIRRTITSFLNRVGGIILIGVKEDVRTKSKIVLGEQYTQDDKQLILKTIRRITQKIYPDVCLSDPYVKTEFVPIRRIPKDVKQKKIQQPYNFIEDGYNPNNFIYKEGFYVIKIIVKPGKKDQLYWYSESNFNQNGQQTTNQYFAFRTENQVLRRQISQEMLSLYRDRLNGNIKIPKSTHQYQCSKPQTGRPIQVKSKKNQQRFNEVKDMFKKVNNFNNQFEKNHGKRGNRNKKSSSSSSESQKQKKSIEKNNQKRKKDHKKQEAYLDPNANAHIPLIYDLQKVIKQTLYYVVLNMNEETIVKTINKTPAKDFTNLTTTRDQLTGKPLYILKVASYSFLQKFLKIKKKIEQFFYKQGVQFIGVGQKIRIENILMRNQAEQILRKDVVLFIVQQNDVFRFLKIETASSYCLKFRSMNIKFDVLPQ